MAKSLTRNPSSSGHALGQTIGDWWEIEVVFLLLNNVARRLGLYLDNRCLGRTCRGKKIIWTDIDGSNVDYDFVLELGGTAEARGVPVAFFESFWRRGSRHSKDKARDDTNKLLPMRGTYPTARFLAIAACGEFTSPARDYIRANSVDLLCLSASTIFDAFTAAGIDLRYSDNASEPEKARIYARVKDLLTQAKREEVAEHLRTANHAAFAAFEATVIARLTATPQEIRFVRYNASIAECFTTVEAADKFLDKPHFTDSEDAESYGYEVTYSDGSEFQREVETPAALRELHDSLSKLVHHMEKLRVSPS